MAMTMQLEPTRFVTEIEVNKAVLRNGIEMIINRQNFESAKHFWATDLIVHVPNIPQPLCGRDVAIEQLFAKLLAAFPDLRIAVDSMIAEGDTVAARWTSYGTHQGDYFGLPATGRAVAVREQVVFRFANGRAQEIWLMPDALGTTQQLGMIGDGPPPRPVLLLIGGIQRLSTIRGWFAGLVMQARWTFAR